MYFRSIGASEFQEERNVLFACLVVTVRIQQQAPIIKDSQAYLITLCLTIRFINTKSRSVESDNDIIIFDCFAFSFVYKIIIDIFFFYFLFIELRLNTITGY